MSLEVDFVEAALAHPCVLSKRFAGRLYWHDREAIQRTAVSLFTP